MSQESGADRSQDNQGLTLAKSEPLARALVETIHSGEVEQLQELLGEHPGLARARIEDDKGGSTSPLHALTDWPGFFPHGPEVVTVLVAAGADPNAPVEGSWHAETPLHGAASTDDVEVARALIDGGAILRRPERRSVAEPRSMTRSATAAGRLPVCSSSGGHELTGSGTRRHSA